MNDATTPSATTPAATTPAASAKSTSGPGPRHEVDAGGSAALGASAKAPCRSLAYRTISFNHF